MIRILFTAFFLSIMASAGFSQSVLPLPEAIRLALANRKNIQSGRIDLSIKRLQTEALYRKYWPQVSIDYLYQFNPILQTSILPIGVFNPSFPPNATLGVKFGTKWSQNAGITLIQPLLDVSTGRQIKEASLQEKISFQTEAQSEYQLAYEVASAYQNISFQETQIISSLEDTVRTSISYKLQKDKYNQNALLKSDLNKSIINHHKAIQKWKDAVSQWIENKIYLLYLIGNEKIDQFDFVVDRKVFESEDFLNKDLPIEKDSIPEIRELQLSQNLPFLQIRTERAKYLPTLNLKGFIGANQFTNSFNPLESGTWFGYSYLGLNLKIPLLIGEDKSRKIKEYRLQQDQFKGQMEDKLAGYSKDILTAKLKLDRAKERLLTDEDNIKLAMETVHIIQLRVKEGQESAATLNTEEANLQSSQTDYETAKKQAWSYWLDYLKATGQIKSLWKPL